MPGFKFVKKLDFKSPDPFMLRTKAAEWTERRFQILQQTHEEFRNCPPEEKARRNTLRSKYNNTFDLLEHAIRFMCEVGLMSERTGKDYVNMMYKFVIEDIRDWEKEREKEDDC